MKHYCIDCKKQVKNYKAKRCRKCCAIFQTGKNNPNYNNHKLKGKFVGINNPSWKGGKAKCCKCKKLLSNYKGTLCKQCWIATKRKPDSYCLDCGNKISRGRKRCRKCYGISQRTYIKRYCLDCNIEITGHTKHGRCKSCARKLYLKLNPGILSGINNSNYGNHILRGRLSGKLNPMYKHGKTHNNKCKNCGTHISYNAVRCDKCHYKTHRGRNHPNYILGLNRKYPLKFNNELKESIRKRDNYTCQYCSKNGISIHHIDYNKTDCSDNNLITLCRNCHAKTNYNRDYWFAYFTYIMENR